MFRLRSPLVIVLLAVVAAGCAVAPTTSASPLAGSRWSFTMIDGAKPVSADARLEFDADNASANVGCNGMGGPWRLEGKRLFVGPLVSTEMWCDGMMEQERTVKTLLSATPEVSISGGRMTLRTGGHSAELVRQ
ncbi:MAG: META domain-containing protein [Sphingomonadales bacterium]|nr:META domain-containing protein [Sphingomonadales bacterium]MBU3991116.1 META domain-containing protein [Alphaproteobacteria bacterium]